MTKEFVLSRTEERLLVSIGEALLGVQKEELDQEYLNAILRYVQGLPEYFYSQVHLLLNVLNSRFMGLFYVLRFQRFMDMPVDARIRFLGKWATSRIPTMRTGFVTLKAICSWGYYSLEKGMKDTGFLGVPLGREHLVPTLLYGKEPWDPKSLEEGSS